MLASITPLGERSRNSRWGVTVTAFALGSTAAGLAAGAALGAAGAPLRAAASPSVRLWIMGALLGVALAFESGLLRPLPTLRRQVNEQWLHRYRGWVYGAGFGIQLGAGVATIVSTSAVYCVLASAVLLGSPLWGALVGGTFGLVRGLSVLPSRRVRSSAALVSLDQRLRRWDRPSRAATAASLTAMAAVAVVAAWR